MDKRERGYRSLQQGASAENFLRGTFTNWGWTVAKPEPDKGADLTVTSFDAPERPGTVFAAQVKSESARKKSIALKYRSASHLKRLPLPAFLFVVDMANQVVRWKYLEPLFVQSRQFTSGGPLNVGLVNANSFSLHSLKPPPELIALLPDARKRGSVKGTPSLASHAKAVTQFYNDIDSRFRVVPTWDGAREIHQIVSVDPSASLNIKIRALSASTQSTMKSAFEWGVGGTASEVAVEVSGSPILDHFGIRNGSGQIEIAPQLVWAGSVDLSLDDPASGFPSNRLTLDAKITRGTVGATLTVARGDWFGMNLQFTTEELRNANIWIETGRLISGPVLNFGQLLGVAEICRAILDQKSAQLIFNKHPLMTEPLRFRFKRRAKPADSVFEQEVRWLELFEAIGVLQARFGFSLSEQQLRGFSGDELNEWKIYGDIARGQRVDLGRTGYKSTNDQRLDLSGFQGAATFIMESDQVFHLNDQTAGVLRTRTTMKKYRIEETSTTSGFEYRFLPSAEDSQCWVEEIPPLQDHEGHA